MVTSVAPASLVQGTATSVVVNGSASATASTVRMTCYDGNNVVVNGATAGAGTVGGGGTTINVSLTAPNGSFYCTVNVTNSDGTSFDYAAIGVTGSSLNLTGFKAGSNLTTARRALAAVAGRPTSVARYVYAIGVTTAPIAPPVFGRSRAHHAQWHPRQLQCCCRRPRPRTCRSRARQRLDVYLRRRWLRWNGGSAQRVSRRDPKPPQRAAVFRCQLRL